MTLTLFCCPVSSAFSLADFVVEPAVLALSFSVFILIIRLLDSRSHQESLTALDIPQSSSDERTI